MKVYIGCSLTHATAEFRAFVPEFKARLARETGVEVLEFLGTAAGTATEVYTKDLGQVTACDVMIALVEEPSTGLGIEIGLAISLHKPLLCLHTRSAIISRMVTGAGELGLLAAGFFADMDEAVALAKNFLQR